jgi:hypothetical protein
MRLLICAAVIVGLTLPLAGCVTTGQSGHSVQLPKASAYYIACFNKLTDIPVGSLTRDKVVHLVAELRKSELAKSQCGKDLLKWYNSVKTAFAK